MRLLGKLVKNVLILAFVFVAAVAWPQAANADNGGCRMSRGYETKVTDLQQLLGVYRDGILGPVTCREVLKLHDVLIESGTIPASQRGLIGPTTFWVLQNPDEKPSGQPRGTSTGQRTDCRVRYRDTEYVICVDVSAQVGSVRRARNGVIGEKVIGTFVVTTSQVDYGKDDSITRNGQYRITAYSLESFTKKLKFFIPFSGDQAFHCYTQVGPGYDSSGCVRLQCRIAEEIYDLLAESGAIDRGDVEAHIYD